MIYNIEMERVKQRGPKSIRRNQGQEKGKRSDPKLSASALEMM
jgi:hypothetical protein